MAKRKRLSPAQSDYLAVETPRVEAKSMPLGPAPIAQVAGEASASAALQELAGEWRQARETGRLIQKIGIRAVDAGYLVRDRLMAEDEELQALMESLRARGQQTPVEVVELDETRFGLISGWRRLTALRRLFEETGEDRFATVDAILRRPDTAADAYVAMVEENEIRVGLSYYERARVAAKAVEQGVFETERQALQSLYASASRPKRSKIGSFLALYHAADDLLRYPAAIGERLGLALAKALDADETRPAALRRLLSGTGAETPEAEQALLQEFLASPQAGKTLIEGKRAPESSSDSAAAPVSQEVGEVAPGVAVNWDGQCLTLSGPGLSASFRAALVDWIRSNG